MHSSDTPDTPLVSTLHQLSQKIHAPFYAPGHKRGGGAAQSLIDVLGSAVFRADLPELPELDNLFAPNSVIEHAQRLAAEQFGADHTWFLVNGSTCGIEAAMLATCAPGDKIVLPRNCHQSAIAGLILTGAVPVFLSPAYDPDWDLALSITPSAVRQALQQHPDAKAVMMVYPTYHGICGDVSAIAQITHEHNIPLIVDEAHGPHFAFHPNLPTPALQAGADIVIQSTHKVLSALTQASMLHLHSHYVDPQRISRALQLVQSTSPSYLLLASLDAARHQMAMQGKALLSHTLTLAHSARDRLSQIPHLRILSLPSTTRLEGFVELDYTRLTVDLTNWGMTGFDADEQLHTKLGVTAELPSLRHLTFIISLGNSTTDIEHLVQAFHTLRQSADPSTNRVKPTASSPSTPLVYPLAPITPRAAYFSSTTTVATADAGDRLSAELICPYPPGIPVLMPGEPITPSALHHLQTVVSAGGSLTGCADPTLQSLRVLQDGLR